MTRIAIIDGHPDPAPGHFIHALVRAYEEGAIQNQHQVRRITVAELDFPLLRSMKEWQEEEVPAALVEAQDAIRWAEHLVIFYPLWLGDMPALLKGFLEQVARPGFALAYGQGGFPKKLLKGRTARVVVTMGMPGLFYRLVYRAHTLKSLERNILSFVGIKPVQHNIIGGVEGKPEYRQKWLDRIKALGAKAR